MVARSALSLLVAVAALEATSSAAVAEPPPPEAVRGCGSRGDSSRPQRVPVPAGARLGPLVIWPSIRTRVEGSGGEWAYYVKAPVIVAARTKVTLAVAPEAAHLVGFQSRGSSWVSSVRFDACHENVRAFPGSYDGTVGRFTGFPFGFGLARRSMCVPLEAWVEGRTTPIRRLVPFGRKTCP
jgi:hypothetical protein